MSTESEIHQASEKFYHALNRMLNGDARPLADIWSHGAEVSTMHPIGGREDGWDQVRRSWEQVAQLSSDGKVGLKDQLIRVAGEVAYEMGTEHGQFSLSGQRVSIEQRVTNIYRRESGVWKIVHHHSDVSPAMLEMLGRAKAET
jgi:ketosteroid isomerase-like protein